MFEYRMVSLKKSKNQKQFCLQGATDWTENSRSFKIILGIRIIPRHGATCFFSNIFGNKHHSEHSKHGSYPRVCPMCSILS